MPRPSSSVLHKTANYTLTTLDEVVLCTGTFTITLPTSVGATGTAYIIKNIGTGLITVNTTSSQTIDGETSQPIIGQWTSMVVVSDGANWYIT